MATLPELAQYDVGRTLQFGQAGQKQRTLADLGRLAAGGDYQGAQAAAFAGGETALGLQLKQMNDADKQQLVNEAASWAYSADSPQKWEAGRSYWLGKGFDPGPFERRDATISQALSVKDKMTLAATNKTTPYTTLGKAQSDLKAGLITQKQYDEIAAGEGGGMFGGTSVEAQGLNYLIQTGALTKDQAAQLAAGKTVSGPNGELYFMTPQGVFSQPPGAPGGPAAPAGAGGPAGPAGPAAPAAPAGGGAPGSVGPPPPPPGLPPPSATGANPALQSAVDAAAAKRRVQLGLPDPNLGGAGPPATATATGAGGGAPQGGLIQLTKPKATDAQSTTAIYADRMVAANPIIEKFEKAGLDWTQPLINQVPVFGGGFTSSDWQQLDQAERDFVNAVLRRESGAAISPSEFESAAKQYFPVPGNKPEVLKQKARDRRIVIEGLIRAAGPAYQPRAAAPAAPAAPAGPSFDWSPDTGLRPSQ